MRNLVQIVRFLQIHRRGEVRRQRFHVESRRRGRFSGYSLHLFETLARFASVVKPFGAFRTQKRRVTQDFELWRGKGRRRPRRYSRDRRRLIVLLRLHLRLLPRAPPGRRKRLCRTSFHWRRRCASEPISSSSSSSSRRKSIRRISQRRAKIVLFEPSRNRVVHRSHPLVPFLESQTLHHLFLFLHRQRVRFRQRFVTIVQHRI